MRTQLEIINDAKMAYERCFNDIHEMSKVDHQDIMLNQETLTNEVNGMKEELLNRMHSLDVLREKLMVEAEQSLDKTFGKEELSKQSKFKTVDEEYQSLTKTKDDLMNWGQELKTKAH